MNKITLFDKLNNKNNNFSFVKLVATFMVILSHSFPIAKGVLNHDHLYLITNNQLGFGSLAVDILFIISGILIANSLEKNSHIKEFIIKKIFRIFIPLILMLFITVFVIGPFFCTCHIKDYFLDSSLYIYFIKNTFLITTHNINNLFNNNVYYQSINGSLWTLPVQFLCYILLLVIFKLKLYKKNTISITNILVLILFIFNIIFLKDKINIIYNAINIGVMFYIGEILCYYKKKIILTKRKFIYSIIILVLLLIFNYYDLARIFCLPYIVVYLSCFTNKIKNKCILKLSDMSYTIYLYSFFIQQCVSYMLNRSYSQYLNVIISVPIIMIVSYLQYNYIEPFIFKLNKIMVKSNK